MQAERIAAYCEFIEDVGAGTFPEARHLVKIDDRVLSDVIARMDADRP